MSSIIVAGGLGILGRAITTELASRGHDVAVVDYMSGAHEDAASVTSGIDLADSDVVKEAYARIAAEKSGIKGLVNVAGGFVWETLEHGSIDSWDRMYRMNLRTAVASSHAILPHLEHGGSIVNIGAAAATDPQVGMAPYTASKAGVAALTASLSEELRPMRIRVNAVLPTIIDTPANRADMPDADLSDWISPQAAARVVAFLLSDEAASITGAQLKLSMGQ
ncbi:MULTISPECIES: SDR family NAD(P)-dependent oxidoreductase [unclassified Sphingopyxis]|jgi:NAD(P)-dependent dehydrogenase (short-subunit alcohol dehydrogenase family)|uniref:SDR family NAD(P)-dependent oxidoreductase n=1 Tax=unclassified Sphingopyxis TaxID=2614943 RepID=UPI0007310D00|nr:MULTISPECIES: SDR family NAD(P)-dependent oxidoreductase [unclassified Sphingopyxis]KTE00685.1 short-chain dehydrogenase [Sphingopyxis sp. H012]KTE11632.1 short-chain dehydrogenase [Sphingopyxis sp. H053]KTE16465.1 short-chain dehydrogenase [Sphingopyxis sp. H093]KTE20912.1 short-chain dehydrogenase [Sphingopyxis sp. H080]KTE33337.1 short-chain dehydrogenase [Sphingopyxis sp. H038]